MPTGSVIHISGIPEFDRHNAELVARVDAASRAIVERGALTVASEAKRTFRPRPGGQRTSQRTGRIYYSYAPPYQAIPPTPTSRSGNLQASIGRIGAATPTSGGWMATTGTKVSYAPFVEFGTRFMRPEPFMEQGLEKSRTTLATLAETLWAEALA